MENEQAELERLGSFVQGELPGVSTVSALMCCMIRTKFHRSLRSWKDELVDLTVSLKRTRVREIQVGHGRNRQIEFTSRFRAEDAILQAFQIFVACPTFTELNLLFPFDRDYRYSLSSDGCLVLRVLSVVRTSRSLPTLGITFNKVHISPICTRFLKEHMPPLLRDNPFFVKLTLTLEESSQGMDGRTIACCFSRNSALKSCTLTTLRCGERLSSTTLCQYNCHPLQNIVSLLTTDVLKELVLRVTPLDRGECGVCQQALADLVARNTTLEKLDAVEYSFNVVVSQVMARAVGCNRSLKEFWYRIWSVAEFKELVHVLVPDESGRQANTSLSTLKLCLTDSTEMLDGMTVLGKLLESNTTLKHVEYLSQELATTSWPIMLSWQGENVYVESVIQGMLEQMLNNELRRNTCLQSLCIGIWWRVLRVGSGDQWEMRYVGPCLMPQAPVLQKEYVVKVKMSTA